MKSVHRPDNRKKFDLLGLGGFGVVNRDTKKGPATMAFRIKSDQKDKDKSGQATFLSPSDALP